MNREGDDMSVLRTSFPAAWGIVMFMASAAMAQTGVSDDRVSLPGGPGSLEGLGENADLDPNPTTTWQKERRSSSERATHSLASLTKL